jgi:hypothetical protein
VEENAYLQGRIDELNRQLHHANEDLREAQTDNYQLHAQNQIIVQDNDDLRIEIGRLRMASQSSQSQFELEEEDAPRQSSKSKGKRPVLNDESDEEVQPQKSKWKRPVQDDESDGEVVEGSEAARVCL